MKLDLADIKYRADDFLLDIRALTVPDGEFFTLLGPSGCGKSTLLRLIAGLLDCTEGIVSLDGNNAGKVAPERRNVGMVFQDLALFPHLSVADNIAYGIKNRIRDASAIKKRVDELLDIMSLGSYRKRRIHTLSGGEKQRVAIARSLAPGPGLLLLDEPLSALDAHMRASLRREIRSLHRALGFTCIYVTHDQDEAFAFSDRIGVMFDGIIIQTDTPETLYDSPGSPDVARFLGYSNEIPGGSNGKTGFVRPEDCTLDSEPGQQGKDTLQIPGTVIYREFSGNGYICGVAGNEGIYQGRAGHRFEPGETCRLAVPLKRIRWL